MSDPDSRSAREHFERAFGRRQELHRVRAPGRVNLIGEHTDYNDLPVLPMAIQRAVKIAFAPRSDARVRLVNVDPRYEQSEFDLSAAIAPASRGDWSNYARAAGQMLCEAFGALRGLDAVVWSDIPPAAGLSSSSALVVACALALLDANTRTLDRLELAELCARGERYVGTQSGGMDQAACLLAERDKALKIDFSPLRVEPLPIPADWRFVIANSLVRAEKSGKAQERYNVRRNECREALRQLAAHPGLQDTPHSYPELLARHSPDSVLELAGEVLEPELFRRLRHVLTEARRVEQARSALLANDATLFGRLMDDSHESLRNDYEVSCAELDLLVRIARDSGALGARLTGAGFGGCIVALCRERDASNVMDSLARRFYGARGTTVDPTSNVWIARASGGSSVEP